MIEFATPNYVIPVLIFALLWMVDFFRLTRRPMMYLPAKYIKSASILFRSILFVCGLVGILLMAYGSAQPRTPVGMSKSEIDVNDIFLVVDVSESMRADDFSPNRLEAAKERIVDFVARKNTDRIGVVMFSEKVFTLLPLTTDKELIRDSISKIQIGYLGSGTNIGDAIGLAVARLTQSLAKSKIIVLLTDGVSNVGSITPVEAAENAKQLGVKIYAIGIGKDKNATVAAGLSNMGNIRYQRVSAGDFDLEVLKKVAEVTGGKSFAASNEKSLSNVLDEIDKLEKTKIESTGKVIYDELYWKFFIVGLVIFVLVEIGRRLILREGV